MECQTQRLQDTVAELQEQVDGLQGALAEAQRDRAAAVAVLRKWHRWCELNRREGSVMFKPTCEVLAALGDSR